MLSFRPVRELVNYLHLLETVRLKKLVCEYRIHAPNTDSIDNLSYESSQIIKEKLGDCDHTHQEAIKIIVPQLLKNGADPFAIIDSIAPHLKDPNNADLLSLFPSDFKKELHNNYDAKGQKLVQNPSKNRRSF